MIQVRFVSRLCLPHRPCPARTSPRARVASRGNRKLCQLRAMAISANDQDLQSRKATLDKMYVESKKSFPDEPDNDIVLVDVRSPDEQNLSVLPGNVIRKDAFDMHKGDYHNNRVVTYCTIGVRSGKYAQQLIAQGLPHVYNLKGSIVAWTQEGLPLWKGDGSQQPTKQVHTFGKTWDLAGPGYEAVSYGAVQGGVEIVRSVLPPMFGGR